ncbi:Similar to Atxn7: Ataxin-7 (Mus musculus) [Cotesia congregata]|uniref:Similar to Atxn7: Ataxin-7 (Mus musculus) n=1 Tax=Cotesia congregata TaxID=51543 RepID=A0A8J2HFW8_COTCN|nr:Similar to Atxn7: Ataxin-7 (Mus musculus) [Cotesia congregata]
MSGSDSPTFFHGQPWSSWIERIGRDKPLNIDLYGFCPERDTFYGVVCEICNAIVKPQALIQHMESRHASGTVNLPPPSAPASKTPVKTPYCKVSKLTKKSQPTTPSSVGTATGGGNSSATSNSKINYSSVKRNAEQANLQQPALANASPRSPLDSIGISGNSTLSGVPSSPVKSPGSNGNTTTATSNNNTSNSTTTNSNSNNGTSANSTGATSTSTTGPGQRRKRLKADRGLVKDREYDPDRHCGVWIEETGKTCTRSLTCKAHTVSLRRTVIGRSKSFDKLLADHRASKELPNRTPKVTVTGTVTVSTASVSGLTGVSGATAGVGLVGNSNDTEAPGSPPVLSLPDTYPLPKAVDLLYRCLAPHGSTKPTKLEEDFANEELRLEASRSAAANPVNPAVVSSSPPSTGPPPPPSSSSSSTPSSLAPTTSKSMLPPISVVLPSLSPIANDTSQHISTLIPVTSSLSSVVSASLAAPQPQLPSTVLEGETTCDEESESMTLYSPVEATTTSTPYSSHFSDIAWSNCHPEPLAVSRWLRITSTRTVVLFRLAPSCSQSNLPQHPASSGLESWLLGMRPASGR